MKRVNIIGFVIGFLAIFAMCRAVMQARPPMTTQALTKVDGLVNNGSNTFGGAAIISPSAIGGTVADYAPTGFASATMILQNTSSGVNMSGLAGGTSGRVLIMCNTGANGINLQNENAGSTASNRFRALSADNVQLAGIANGNSCAWLFYDSVVSRWRVVSINTSVNLATISFQAISINAASTFSATITQSGTYNLGQALNLTGVISPTALGAGPTANYAPTGGTTISTIRQDMSANGVVSGLSISQVNGRTIILHNISATNTLTLNHEDAASTAGNRFVLPNNANLVLQPNSSNTLRYDGTSSRWRVIAL